MGSASNYTEKKCLDHVLKVSAFTQPSNLYVALFTTSPGDDDSGVEVSGGSYARVSFTDWITAAKRESSNDSEIAFPTPTASWGTVVAAGLYDAVSGGNLLFWDELSTSRDVGIGDDMVIEEKEFDVRLRTGGWSTVLANALIDHVLLIAVYTQPTNLYVALYTSTPTDAGVGTEVSGGSYARELENTWDAASGALAQSQNTNQIEFVLATLPWGLVVSFGIHDDLSAEQLLIYGDLDTPVNVLSGEQPRFPEGDLICTCD